MLIVTFLNRNLKCQFLSISGCQTHLKVILFRLLNFASVSWGGVQEESVKAPCCVLLGIFRRSSPARGMWRRTICCLANGCFESLILLSEAHLLWIFDFLGQVSFPCSAPHAHPFLKRFLLVLVIFMRVVHVAVEAGRGNWIDVLQLVLQVVLSSLTWVLATELWCALQCWVVSPDPWCLFLSYTEIWKQAMKLELSWGISVTLCKITSNIQLSLLIEFRKR